MKKIIWIFTLLLLVVSCKEEYVFNAQFKSPTSLNSPASVVIDVTSPDNIHLSWNGGGAESGLVIYEVLFDKKGGDFSNPVYRSLSDLGVDTTFTLTNALLNTISRKAGIATSSTGNVIWTVTTSKGGVVKKSDLSRTISVTRGSGIDYTGNTLFLFGTATENNGAGGQEMRKEADGVFVAYTKAEAAGNYYFKSSTATDAFVCHSDVTGKIVEGAGAYDVTANATNEVYRITVDLNTQKLTIDLVTNLKAIWGVTFNVIGAMQYQGSGIFKADNCTVKFIMSTRPDTNPPSWLSWTEERYYFIATINGVDKCFGRRDGVSSERPTGTETPDFYELIEFPWTQWDHLWKMSGALDMTKCTITVNTNKDGLMVHTFSNIVPIQ